MRRDTERWMFERAYGNPLFDDGRGLGKRKPSKIRRIITRAIRTKRVKDGLVLCDVCDTPASKSLSLALSWTCCAPCVWGEAGSFDETDLIYVEGRA
jgi:hypothetical protein